MALKGNQLKLYLERNDISIAQAAQELSVAQPTIYKWLQSNDLNNTITAKITLKYPDIARLKTEAITLSGDELLSYIRRKQLSFVAASEELGVTRTTLTNWIKEPVLKDRIVIKILSQYPDIKQYIEQKRRRESDNIIVNGLKIIPLLPVFSHGGHISTQQPQCENITSPFENADIAVRVAGNAMSPDFKNGSIVFLVRMEKEDTIIYGNYYLLDTNFGIFLRMISKGENNTLACIAINPYKEKYATFNINRDEIVGIYRVVGEITEY